MEARNETALREDIVSEGSKKIMKNYFSLSVNGASQILAKNFTSSIHHLIIAFFQGVSKYVKQLTCIRLVQTYLTCVSSWSAVIKTT